MKGWASRMELMCRVWATLTYVRHIASLGLWATKSSLPTLGFEPHIWTHALNLTPYMLTAALPVSTAPEGSRRLFPVVARTPHPVHSALWHLGWSAKPFWKLCMPCQAVPWKWLHLSPPGALRSLLSTPIAFPIDFSLSPLTGAVVLTQDGFNHAKWSGDIPCTNGTALPALPTGPHVFSQLVAVSGKQQCGQHWERSHARKALIIV